MGSGSSYQSSAAGWGGTLDKVIKMARVEEKGRAVGRGRQLQPPNPPAALDLFALIGCCFSKEGKLNYYGKVAQCGNWVNFM